MRLLAFDTSTETLAVALRADDRSWHDNAPGGAAASASLLARVDALLDAAGLAMSQLEAIAFGQGPGAFTGLRTSCAAAQGLGFGLGRPLLPIDSLLVVAEDARVQAGLDRGEVAVAMDARMDEAYAARYRFDDGRWSVLQAPALYALPALAAAWAGACAPRLVAGSALAAFGQRLPVPAGAATAPQESDRAAALLRLACAAFAVGAGVDAAVAAPLYLRDKVALTTAERAAVQAAAPPLPARAARAARRGLR